MLLYYLRDKVPLMLYVVKTDVGHNLFNNTELGKLLRYIERWVHKLFRNC